MPVSRKNTGAQKCVIQRVRNSAAVAVREVGRVLARDAEEVARVVERHQDHDHAAHDVDRFEARASGCGAYICAPVFFLLTGTGAYLSLRRKSPRRVVAIPPHPRPVADLPRAVVVRCLVYQFNVDFQVTMLLVLWALGWAMIVLVGADLAADVGRRRLRRRHDRRAQSSSTA